MSKINCKKIILYNFKVMCHEEKYMTTKLYKKKKIYFRLLDF